MTAVSVRRTRRWVIGHELRNTVRGLLSPRRQYQRLAQLRIVARRGLDLGQRESCFVHECGDLLGLPATGSRRARLARSPPWRDLGGRLVERQALAYSNESVPLHAARGVVEPRVLTEEHQSLRTDGASTMLGDDDLG